MNCLEAKQCVTHLKVKVFHYTLITIDKASAATGPQSIPISHYINQTFNATVALHHNKHKGSLK